MRLLYVRNGTRLPFLSNVSLIVHVSVVVVLFDGLRLVYLLGVPSNTLAMRISAYSPKKPIQIPTYKNSYTMRCYVRIVYINKRNNRLYIL